MENFIELARRRYSCRNYQDRAVEQHKIDMVLEAGRIAPSAVNFQPWKFILIRDQEYLERIRGCYHRKWFATAKIVIMICADHEQSWKRKDGKDHADIDAAIAADHMTLAATSAGLATCWVCNFDAEACSSAFGLPDTLEPVVLLPLGYADDEAEPDRDEEKRKAMEDIVFEDYYRAG